jgi:hypothetical protein
MSKCIYCFKDERETTFVSREHVIPQCLGTFTPLNPTIKGNIVCDSCNTKVLSPLETYLMEDTFEGFQAQRLNLNGRNSITMRNENFKVEVKSGLKHEFFNRMIFPLKPKDGKIVPYLKTQVKFNGLGGIYCRVFFPEALKEIKKDSSLFKKISDDMKKLSQKDICVFAETHKEMDEIISLLKDYGVNYKEKERYDEPFKDGKDKFELNEDYSCAINHTTGRVLVKIALNYFAYCCMQDSMEDILFLKNFDQIREYAFAGKGNMKDFIVSINEEPITYEEKQSGKRFISHIINFVEEDGFIVLRMTFFGCQAIYKIILGKIPNSITTPDFGCGHFFNPFSKEIINIINKPTPVNLTDNDVRLTFGLQKRFII